MDQSTQQEVHMPYQTPVLRPIFISPFCSSRLPQHTPEDGEKELMGYQMEPRTLCWIYCQSMNLQPLNNINTELRLGEKTKVLFWHGCSDKRYIYFAAVLWKGLWKLKERLEVEQSSVGGHHFTANTKSPLIHWGQGLGCREMSPQLIITHSVHSAQQTQQITVRLLGKEKSLWQCWCGRSNSDHKFKIWCST